MDKFDKHKPVLLEETRKIIRRCKFKNIVDCTFGTGGHAQMFLEEGCAVTALDLDSNAKKYELKNSKFKLHIDNFVNFDQYLSKPDFVFADLGTATTQLTSNRGFSFMHNSPLNMCMGSQPCVNAKDLLRQLSEQEIATIIHQYGEEKAYKKYAKNIAAVKNSINTTFDLKKAIGTDEPKVLARIFQALRIKVNNEIWNLVTLLQKIKKMQTCAAIISYHSLEHNLIEIAFEKFDFIKPTKAEIALNPNARSAQMRFYCCPTCQC